MERPGTPGPFVFRPLSRKRVAETAMPHGILCGPAAAQAWRSKEWHGPHADRSAPPAEPAPLAAHGRAGASDCSRSRRDTKAAQAADDAAVRPDRTSQKLQSECQRGSAQTGLRLRHEGAWHADTGLGRSLFLASA